MDHLVIAQAANFAMLRPKLGEEVANTVVLREGQGADERAIRDFPSRRLTNFKVPRKVLVLEEIPKGATGKLQRNGPAENLGLE